MKIIKYGLIGAMSLMLAACGNGGEEGADNGAAEDNGSGESVTLQLGHALSPGTPASDQIDQVAENVSERTEGRVEFDVYPDSQLGSETEMLEQIQVGSMQSGAIMVGSMQALDMKMAIEDLPYMWADIENAREAYRGEFGEALADIMADQGMTQIGYLEWGFRHITNNEGPIVEPEDLQGLNIRVAETALRVDAFEQVGALPTVMAFSEVYGALQQGALDAQENPLANIVAPRFYEVQDYLSLTGHFYNTVMVVADTDTWDTISEEDQQVILEEFETASEEVQTENDAMEDEYLAELEENGMEINDNVNTEAFREAMLPVYEEWEEDVFGEELMDIYREASGWED
ncbi:DctP family TRAP transporter solute-binding subunit [Salinicoccus halitifaciens]|uniref:Tripartite ATP-independent transporter DctP family solute receptor n=1 Tax=Salinicoccus halitifaciens TaxID=1073415 RepID=A0ABV2ECC2_9STAP|nr:DctP family TRAP transporter solute-binding subunit [Salinicoccus halitifaciens]MCD2138767.1 DctP family TRAP transporter solute-binding subunit [Salinicoccus halitifaciens]